MHNNFYLKLLTLMGILLLVSIGQMARSQNLSVWGKITDSNNGSALPGVNILVKGTTNGTISDAEGAYSLTIQADDPVLVFNSIGYITQEIAVGNQREINVQMAEDVASLEEVVVVGYGTQKKSNINGAIASVSGEELEKVQVASWHEPQ